MEGRPEKSLFRHKELFKAIKAGDKELAAKVMREHIEDVETSLFAEKRKEERDRKKKKDPFKRLHSLRRYLKRK